MKPEYMYAFYEFVILPQFGVEDESIGWQKSSEIGPDEMAHFFSTATSSFILIFEDYNGLGRDPAYIKETLGLGSGEYMFISPKAVATPSFHFIPHAPYKYAPGITGTFTLLKLRKKIPIAPQSLLHVGARNNSGWVQAFQEKS